MQCTWEEYLWNVSVGCFFRLLPSFVMVGITHHLDRYSKRRIDLRGAGMRRAEQAEREREREPGGCKAQHDAASWFDLYSLCFAAPLGFVSSWHLHLRKQAPATSLCWSTHNVKRCEDTQSAVYQEIPSDVILLVFVSPKHPSRDKQRRFGKCCCTEVKDFNTEVSAIQDVQDVKLKHSAAVLLLDRRKWDQTQSLCLMKTDPLCLGLLEEKDTWGTPLCLLNPPITS